MPKYTKEEIDTARETLTRRLAQAHSILIVQHGTLCAVYAIDANPKYNPDWLSYHAAKALGLRYNDRRQLLRADPQDVKEALALVAPHLTGTHIIKPFGA